MATKPVHLSVMLNEVLCALSPRSDAIYVDGTFGLGGYSRAILEDATGCHVVAFDRDPAAFEAAEALSEKYKDRFAFIHAPFAHLKEELAKKGIEEIDGLVLDLGVSSPQLDCAERGFSFRWTGPLDMRMSQEGETAADVVNSRDEEALAAILWDYGEEKKSRQIARKIVHQRQIKKFETTEDLAKAVYAVIPRRATDKIDPATRTFQALRIYVNQEMEQLESILHQSLEVLKDGGRLVVVSFHSLEDRIVKTFLRAHTQFETLGSRYLPVQEPVARPVYFEIHKSKVILPQEEEIEGNPRARSAKLRWAILRKTEE